MTIDTLKCPHCQEFIIDEAGKGWILNHYNTDGAAKVCYCCKKTLPEEFIFRIPVNIEVGYNLDFF